MPFLDEGHPGISSLPPAFLFSILGQIVRVECSDPSLRTLIATKFGAMAATQAGPSDLDYTIQSGPTTSTIVRAGRSCLPWSDPDDLLFLLEKDLTVELQKRRPDLYFLHSAALAWNGKACLLAAEAGSGKSTTTWGLLHYGFRYLSDELSPLDPKTLAVYPYPHALCLKQPPPHYRLPAGTVDLGRTLHVPVGSLPSETITKPLPLGAVFLLKYRPDLGASELRAIGPAEAAARLYLTALNALSHPHRGLDAAVRIAEQVPCFAIDSADLPATCALIRSALAE